MDRADTELIEALRRGEDGALSVLLTRHAPGVYRFGLKMCRDPEDAKDVVQDTLLAAARGVRDFRGASSISTWLYTIARSFCIKKRRGVKPGARDWVDLDDHVAAHAVPSTELAPDDAAATHELGEALEHAIAALPPMYREVLLLRDVEGLQAPEVAEVLGLSIDAVKSRLHRARADVRGKLERFAPVTTPSVRPPVSGSGCPDIVTMFSRYVENEISSEECAAMERHIETCTRCNAACGSLKQTLALCRAEPRGEVPIEIQDQVRRAVREFAAAGI